MAPAPSSSPFSAATLTSKKMPEIITIPEQFYGVALKLKALTSAEKDEAARVPPPAPASPKPTGIIRPPEARRTPWAMVGVVAGVVVLSGGGFVYFNRDALFRKTAPMVVVEPKPIPQAPSGLSALPSQGAVSLAWTDAANNEQGYHIERKDGALDSTNPFNRITTLPASSNAFIDVTVQPSAAYSYHVIATGEGGDSAPSNDILATTPALPAPETLKPALPPGGLDTDSDGLTDAEESLYGTNTQKPDSDGDRFLDGNEVFHLYNPAAAAPGKLLESGLVRSFTAASGWVMYLPAAWTSGPDPSDPGRVLLETGKGERFVVSVESNPSRQDLIPWVSARINQPPEALGEFTTKGGLRGVYAPDRMRAWLAWGDAVFHLTLDLQAQPFVNFRTTLEMMLNSLMLNGAAILPTNLTPANSGPGSLLDLPASSTPIVSGTATSTDTAPLAASSTLLSNPTSVLPTSSTAPTP